MGEARAFVDGSPTHLLHRASQLITMLLAEQSGDFDITPRQLVLLKAISSMPKASQTQLVAATGVDRSTVAEIMTRLSKKGYVTRQRTKEDVRAYALELTDAGRAVLRRAEPMGERVDKMIMDMLPASRRQQFLADLRALGSLASGAASSKR